MPSVVRCMLSGRSGTVPKCAENLVQFSCGRRRAARAHQHLRVVRVRPAVRRLSGSSSTADDVVETQYDCVGRPAGLLGNPFDPARRDPEPTANEATCQTLVDAVRRRRGALLRKEGRRRCDGECEACPSHLFASLIPVRALASLLPASPDRCCSTPRRRSTDRAVETATRSVVKIGPLTRSAAKTRRHSSAVVGSAESRESAGQLEPRRSDMDSVSRE